jgi:hypothetical protein
VRSFKLESWTVPVALTIVVALPITGWAAERCVLGEYFTATW